METAISIPTFEEYEAKRASEETRRGSKRSKCPPAYDPASETPPDHAWFNIPRTTTDKQVHDAVDMVTDITATARKEDKELVALRKMGRDVRDILLKSSSDVAIVGQQGMGKSLMINALMDRHNLSKTSAKGGACTASAIKYRHKPGVKDREESYDAEVEFMDDECLHEIASEHVRRYRHFHYSNNVDPDCYFEEEQAAQTALDFFRLVFNSEYDSDAKKQLKELLQESNVKNGELLSATLQQAISRIEEANVNADRIIYFKGMGIEGLMKKVEKYIADAPDMPTLWPIVHGVTIRLGSSLARNGVCLIDLPGLGDLNQSRTAATNATRRKAEFEVIVAKSERVTTEDVVDHQIKQSIKVHGAKNTVLVLTKIDEYFLDNNSVDQEINRSSAYPFPLIKRLHMEAEQEIADLEESGDDDLVDKKIDALCNYQEHLVQLAQYAFIRQRANDMEIQMRNRYLKEDPNPIHVLSITASMYLDWLKQRKQRPCITAHMTGVPTLRKFLLSFAAERNYQSYQEHIEVKLPLFIDKVRRIAQDEKKNDAYVIIRPRFRQLVSAVKTGFQSNFDTFLKSRLEGIWTDSSQKYKKFEKFSSIVEEWGNGVAWNTYNKALREKGIVPRTQAKKYVQPEKRFGSINWNDELSVELAPDMGTWKRRMNAVVTAFARDLANGTVNVCEDIVTSMTTSSLPPDLKHIALGEWNKCQDRILAHSKRCEPILREAIKLTHLYATTETDTRCMLAKVNWDLYGDVESTPRGTGFFVVQRDVMRTSLKEPDSKGRILVDRVSSAVKKEAKKNLRCAFSEFMDELIKELELFDEHIGDHLPADYTFTALDKELRSQLRTVLPQLEAKVRQLQDLFRMEVHPGGEENAEDSRGEPAAKKVKSEPND